MEPLQDTGVSVVVSKDGAHRHVALNKKGRERENTHVAPRMSIRGISAPKEVKEP